MTALRAYGNAEQTRNHEDWRARELRELGELADARRGVIAQLDVDLDVLKLERGGASSFLPEQLYALLHQVTAKRGRTDNLQLLVCSEIHVELMRCAAELRYSSSMFMVEQTRDDYAVTFAGVPVRRDRELDRQMLKPRSGRIMACPIRREPERTAVLTMPLLSDLDAERENLKLRRERAELKKRVLDLETEPKVQVPSHLKAELEGHRADAERRRAEDAKIDREFETIVLHLRALLSTAASVGAIAYVLYLCGVFG